MKYNLLFLFLVLTIASFSQTTIKGKVISNNKEELSFISVLVKKDTTENIITYTTTNENGFYNLSINLKGRFRLVVSALGYEKKSVPFSINGATKTLTKNITLIEKPFELNEVIIQAEKPIKIKKDTIVFKASKFLKGNEEVVEDLLKNIPGLNIDSEGTIKVGNKEVEKVMVDGDDFFERGYKILTKNMPPKPIDKVEILQRYSNNKLLKNVEESDKIALNLVLKEDAKRVWFGNLNIGYGLASENRYRVQANLMNFGKKNKYYFLTNFNNTGYNATGDIEHLIRPFRLNEPSSIGDNQKVNNLLFMSSLTPSFKASRTNFNNTEMMSVNAIFTLSKKVKLKALGFFNADENDFFRNTISAINTNNISFTNIEDFNLRKTKKVGFGKIDLSYDISKTKLLETSTKYNHQDENNLSNLIFNTQNTIENLQSNNQLFDQKIAYTNKFKDNKVFLLTGRYINEKTPQNYHINQFFYQDLFSSTSANNIKQSSENKMQYAGFEAHLLDRKKNKNLLEIQIGNEYRKDELETNFQLKQNSNIVLEPTEFQNQLTYSSNDLYIKGKYHYKFNKVTLTSALEIHQLFNHLESNNTFHQNPLFVNPKLGFQWEIDSKNKINASYSFNKSNATVLDVFPNYVLTGFRSFSKGTGNFNQLAESSAFFNYQLGSWSDSFFANIFLLYSKNHDFFSTNTNIEQNYSQSQKILIKDREYLSLNSNIDRYLKFVSSNIKFTFGYSKSNYKNSVNSSDLREIKSNNYNYAIELRSGFSGFFNYHIGTKWMTNQIETVTKNSFTNNTAFLDLNFYFNNKLSFDIQTERYLFGNSNSQNNTYYFADFNAQFKPKNKKYTFTLVGKNLFNTKQFKEQTISDIGTTATEYRLLPRYILLKLQYRF